MDDVSVDVGKPEVAAPVTVSESGVVNPQQVQDGGMIIMHMNSIANNLVANIVCLTIYRSPFNASPC